MFFGVLNMRDHWGNPIGDSKAEYEAVSKPVQELNQGELRALITDAVFRGAVKAIATVMLVSALIGFVIFVIEQATKTY